MDASDKIIEFKGLESLKQAILADRDSKDVLAQRYCVRFIMLNNFEAFRELTKFLCQECGVLRLELDKLAYGNDKTLTIDQICDAINEISESTILTPFSELVRFYKDADFNGFFNEVILTESIRNTKKRIYIPIIGLHNRFTDFLKNFGRIEESAPIWQYYTEKDDKVIVYVSKYRGCKLPDHQNICELSTMRDWLKFWKQQAPKERILCSASPIMNGYVNSKPDSIFTFYPISNAYEFIRDFFEINLPIEYSECDDAHWDNLLQGINSSVNNFSFSRYVSDYFNRKTIAVNDIINIWASEDTSEYGRWLLKHLALSFEFFKDNSYITMCLKETSQLNVPNALFENIAERIFYAQTQAEFEKSYLLRREIIASEPELFRNLVSTDAQNWIKSKIIEIVQNGKDITFAINYCTGVFDFERSLFLGWYLICDDSKFDDDKLKEFYPELTDYLSSFEDSVVFGKEWALEYFKNFRIAKLNDTYSDEIHQAISLYNKDEDSFYDWYYAFKESHNLLQTLKSDSLKSPDKIYWIDGLGAEFLPFIMKQISKSNLGYSVIHSEIARTTIPSNTHLNSFEVDNITNIKISDLDELAHSGHYVKYTTFIEELSTVQKIISSILNDNKVGIHTIAIVSDHGLSSLSRKCPSKKLTGKSNHEGRYIPITEDTSYPSDTDYVVHTNERDGKKYKVALTHSSLGKVPTHEVHGGCTPEEVLVPFIVLSNNDEAKPIPYNVSIISDSIAISDGKLSFTINPEPQSAEIIIDDVKHNLEYNDLKWSYIVTGLSEGNHNIKVIPHKGESKSFVVNFFGMGFGNNLMDLD